MPVLRLTNLWRQVAPIVGGKLIEGLCADVAAPERLGGDNLVKGGEWLFHGGTDRRRLITNLQKY